MRVAANLSNDSNQKTMAERAFAIFERLADWLCVFFVLQERLGRFIPHFVQLLAEWTETFPYDFRDERVMVHVRTITQKCVTVDPSIRKEVSTLLQNLLVRLTTLEKYEEFLERVNAESSTDSLEGLSSVSAPPEVGSFFLPSSFCTSRDSPLDGAGPPGPSPFGFSEP